MIRSLFRPKVLLPALLGVSLLGALLAFGDVRHVGALLSTFHAPSIAAILLVLVAYETVQCAQWNLLLRAEGLHVRLRAGIFAYLVGDMARILPIGNYMENYLLLREEGTDFGLSSAATTLSVLIEVAVCLTGLAILGLGSWTWVRPVIVVGLGVFLPVAWLTYKRHHRGALPSWLARRRLVCKALDELHQFRLGIAALLRPRVLAPAVTLGATYVLLGGTALFLVARGLGIDQVSWPAVLTVYFFSVAFALIFPLPIDLGVYEVSGVGAFFAIGVEKSDAVSSMLLLRVMVSGAALIIALAAIGLLRDQVRAVLRERPSESPKHELRADPGSDS